MKKFILIITIVLSSLFHLSVKSEFGDADFDIDNFITSPKSYHDGWCRFINNKCRIRFQKNAMWVEGQGGIYLSQFIKYRYDTDKGAGHNIVVGDKGEYYNYITYKTKNNEVREALFLFKNYKAQQGFSKSLMRWVEQTNQPTPNYRYPNSQGPQDTQGKDKGLNPYDNPLIDDWSIKTTEKGIRGKINCDSPVWEKKPICN